jgi:mRNA interferase MazF
MTVYRPGEVLLVVFPFTGGQGKRRPALVIADSGDNDLLLARITTQPARTSLDVAILDWQQAGLLTASIVRVDKLATIEKGLIVRSFGTISSPDRRRVGDALRALIQHW